MCRRVGLCARIMEQHSKYGIILAKVLKGQLMGWRLWGWYVWEVLLWLTHTLFCISLPLASVNQVLLVSTALVNCVMISFPYLSLYIKKHIASHVQMYLTIRSMWIPNFDLQSSWPILLTLKYVSTDLGAKFMVGGQSHAPPMPTHMTMNIVNAEILSHAHSLTWWE